MLLSKILWLVLLFLGASSGFIMPPTAPAPAAAGTSSKHSIIFRQRALFETRIGPTNQQSLDEETPSTVFGRPLDDDTKERNKQLVNTLKSLLFDYLFSGDSIERSYARFYALETIARMPYFSYLSVLHLFETLGKWRKANYLKVHFSEAWNELHHLLIMEELGGSSKFQDRFVAQHVAFFYYWIVIALYLFNPSLAYNLNQAVEEEAFQTYDKFLTLHKDFLQGQPATQTAQEYYRDGDLYMFDLMQTSAGKCNVEMRRPKIETLYDVFCAIRDDEKEHVKTMVQLQLPGSDDVCDL
jgi:ubiquinol oxidase